MGIASLRRAGSAAVDTGRMAVDGRSGALAVAIMPHRIGGLRHAAESTDAFRRFIL